MDRYYYSKNGNDVQGPIEINDLLRMNSAGILQNATQVCREGAETWGPLQDMISAHKTANSHAPRNSFSGKRIALILIPAVIAAAIAINIKLVGKNATSAVVKSESSAAPLTTAQPQEKAEATTHQNPLPTPDRISDATKKDIQNIVISGERSLILAGDAIRYRKSFEDVRKILKIKVDGGSQLARIGAYRQKDIDETNALFEKSDVNNKQFHDAVSKFTENHIALKTQIDFLSIPSSPPIKSEMQDTVEAWAQFCRVAEKCTINDENVSKNLEELNDRAAKLFGNAKKTVNKQFSVE